MRKKKSNQPSDFELDKYGVWVKTKLGSSFDTTQNIEKEVERTEPPRSFTPQKNDSFTFDSIHTQIENIKKDLSDLKNEIKDSKIENFSLFSNKPVDFFADHPSLKSESNSSDFGIGSLSKTDDLLSDFDTSEQNNNPTEKDKQDAELSSSIDSLFTDDLELTEEDIRSFDEETQPTCVNDKFDFFDEKNIEETLPEEATSDLILDPLEDFDLPEEKEIEFPKAKESDEDNDFFDIFNFNFKEPEESDKQKEEQPLEEVTSSDGEAIFDNEHFSFFDDNKIAPTEEPIVEEPIVEEPIVEEPMNRLSKNRLSKNRLSKNRLSKNRLSKNRLSKNRLSKIRLLKIRLLKIRLLKIRLLKIRLLKNRLLKILNRPSFFPKTIPIWMTSVLPIQKA